MARSKDTFNNANSEISADEERRLNDGYKILTQAVSDAEEITASAKAIAIRVGYDGPITAEALDDGIHFYSCVATEALVEIGRRLLVRKEITPHGQFTSWVESRGFSIRTAQRFMSAALRAAGSKAVEALSHRVASPTKFIEMLVLDDDDIQKLVEGGSINGITLDKTDKISAADLRRIVREKDDIIAAKDKLIQQKNATIDRITEENAAMENKIMLQTPEEQMLAQRDRFQRHAMTIKAHIMTDFRRELKELYEQEGDHRDFAAACFIEIFKELTILRDEYGLERVIREDGMPEWLTPEALSEIEAMGGEA